MAGWVDVSDASPTDATSGLAIGGINFGSMGSGKHTTTAGGLPTWVLVVAAAAALFVVLKKGRV